MIRIELAGPPGVGKTTLMKQLARMLPDAITARRLPLYAHFEDKGRRWLTEWLYARRGGERWMRHRLEKAMVRGELKRLRDAEEPWPGFLSDTMRAFVEAGESPALILERLQSFTRQVAAVHCADRLQGEQLVLFDEGLVQRGISLAHGSADHVVESYCGLMPLPAMTVLLTADSATIHERLKLRNPSVDRFHGMVERALQVNERIARAIAQRGGGVVELSMEQLPETAAADVATRLAAMGMGE